MANRTRPIRVNLYFTQAELDDLNQKAKASGLSREAYIRSLISGYVPNTKPHEDFLETIKQLRYIGNNLNQLAIVANKNHLVDSDALKKEVALLNEQIKEIREKVYLPRRIE